MNQRTHVRIAWRRRVAREVGLAIVAALLVTAHAAAQEPPVVAHGDSAVTIRIVDADLRAAIQALARYLDRPVVIGTVPGVRVTLETPTPVPRAQVPAILRGLIEAHDLELVESEALFRIGARTQDQRARRGAAADTAGPPLELFVIRLRHARAADVAATVNQLFGAGGSFSGAPGFSTGTLSDELRRTAEETTRPPPAGTGMAQAPRSASLVGPVTIVPDALTNALLVRASAADHALIRTAVEQLDLRPLQVLIEVLIVEVRRDRAFALGVNVSVDNVDLGAGATGSGFLVGGGLGTFALQVMRLGSFDVHASLEAAVARGDARIVSRPIVVASNNREARILVGSQRPFVQVSRSLPTDTPTRDQVVQYRDVGTKLTVLPTINADGYVALFLQQEVNAATSETQFDAPVISTREATTTVLVRDGQTVVLGGLRERQQEVSKSGIPLLSAIPVIGGLFGVEDRRTTETELFLFITPTVLADDAAADAAARRTLDQAEKRGLVPDPPGDGGR